MAAFHAGSDCSLPCFEEGRGAIRLHLGLGFQSERSTELLLGEPSGLCERGAARSSPAARRGAPKLPLTRGRRTLCPQTGLGDQLALWAV